MDEDTRLRLEYDNGSELLRGLTETRFRLLALVPTVAGAVVALINGPESAAELLAIGLLGLCASVGVLLYELRNGEIQSALAQRVTEVERVLLPHGPLAVVPRSRLFGFVPVSRSGAIAGLRSRPRRLGLSRRVGSAASRGCDRGRPPRRARDRRGVRRPRGVRGRQARAFGLTSARKSSSVRATTSGSRSVR